MFVKSLNCAKIKKKKNVNSYVFLLEINGASQFKIRLKLPNFELFVQIYLI